MRRASCQRDCVHTAGMSLACPASLFHLRAQSCSKRDNCKCPNAVAPTCAAARWARMRCALLPLKIAHRTQVSWYRTFRPTSRTTARCGGLAERYSVPSFSARLAAASWPSRAMSVARCDKKGGQARGRNGWLGGAHKYASAMFVRRPASARGSGHHACQTHRCNCHGMLQRKGPRQGLQSKYNTDCVRTVTI